ncbi:hypothetical protein [Aromatoleum sp.]|uniref:hypothetical protein n=1 Tax=Aromatoleum sp. TaxID=2307007 RepID=UPI002FC9AF58
MWRLLLVLMLFAPLAARSAEAVDVCFNYGCAGGSRVAFSDARLREVRALLADASDAAAERDAIAAAVGRMYRIAAGQSPIGADRAGNYLDGGVVGRMDCIDHSTTTGRFLALLESRGWLRFHRVAEPARRTRIIFQHFSAVIEETGPAAPEPERERDHVPLSLTRCDCQNDEEFPRIREPEMQPPQQVARRFAVDSWFVEPGEPAVLLPLQEWMNGEGPNVQ